MSMSFVGDLTHGGVTFLMQIIRKSEFGYRTTMDTSALSPRW